MNEKDEKVHIGCSGPASHDLNTVKFNGLKLLCRYVVCYFDILLIFYSGNKNTHKTVWASSPLGALV